MSKISVRVGSVDGPGVVVPVTEFATAKDVIDALGLVDAHGHLTHRLLVRRRDVDQLRWVDEEAPVANLVLGSDDAVVAFPLFQAFAVSLPDGRTEDQRLSTCTPVRYVATELCFQHGISPPALWGLWVKGSRPALLDPQQTLAQLGGRSVPLVLFQYIFPRPIRASEIAPVELYVAQYRLFFANGWFRCTPGERRRLENYEWFHDARFVGAFDADGLECLAEYDMLTSLINFGVLRFPVQLALRYPDRTQTRALAVHLELAHDSIGVTFPQEDSPYIVVRPSALESVKSNMGTVLVAFSDREDMWVVAGKGAQEAYDVMEALYLDTMDEFSHSAGLMFPVPVTQAPADTIRVSAPRRLNSITILKKVKAALADPPTSAHSQQRVTTLLDELGKTYSDEFDCDPDTKRLLCDLPDLSRDGNELKRAFDEICEATIATLPSGRIKTELAEALEEDRPLILARKIPLPHTDREEMGSELRVVETPEPLAQSDLAQMDPSELLDLFEPSLEKLRVAVSKGDAVDPIVSRLVETRLAVARTETTASAEIRDFVEVIEKLEVGCLPREELVCICAEAGEKMQRMHQMLSMADFVGEARRVELSPFPTEHAVPVDRESLVQDSANDLEDALNLLLETISLTESSLSGHLDSE